jgi:hypothetical protein
MRAAFIIATGLLGACLFATPAIAGAPSIESVAPGVSQRGAEFQLRLVGAGLEEAADLMLYFPGVVCTGIQASENEATATLRAAADCPLGSHPFRLRTKQGISELRVFRVTQFPVVAEVEPNGSVNEAQPVDRNVTVTGVIEAGDVDGFELTLHRGDRLAAEVEAVRMGGTMLDTVLTVFGPDGKKLGSVDDTSLFHQDPFVTFVAPVDGRYVVQVRETSFDGDENSRYAIHLGTFPRPAYVFPAGGQAGQSMTVRFGGDAAGDFDQEVRLPEAQNEKHALFAMQNGLAAPTPNPFRVSAFPNVLEAEPNDDPQSGGRAAAELPTAFNGILERAGDVDCFRFRAEAGAAWQFETFAARLGTPLDSLISISDGTGKVLVSNDDDGTHDSRLVFAAPRAGEYVLSIVDKRGAGGANFVYRIEAAAPRPRLATFLPRPNRLSQERQAIVVPRGNRVMALIGTQRTAFEGNVHLASRGLPSGVSFSEADVPPDLFCVPVVFESEADSPFAGGLAEVLATGESLQGRLRGGFVQVVDLVAGSADTLFASVEVDRLAVSVVEEHTFSISLDEPKTELAQDGTISLPIHVERTADFAGPVDVTVPFLPPWVDGPEKITIPEGESNGVYTARAFPQAEARRWRLGAEARPAGSSARQPAAAGAGGSRASRRMGRSSGSGAATAVSSKLVTLRIAASPVSGTIGTVVAEQGKELTLVCQLTAKGVLPPQMTATLEGLPNRVSANSVDVSADDRTVSFAVQVEPTAPVGSFPSLVCRLTGNVDGQEVSYCIGRGGVLRIERAGALVTDASGRPLSRLEVLRKSRSKVVSEKKSAQ